MFVQIRIFLKLIEEMEFKRRSVLIIKYYDDYFTLDILYTFVNNTTKNTTKHRLFQVRFAPSYICVSLHPRVRDGTD